MAKYLIDAKKDIDSLIYLDDNFSQLLNMGIKDFIYSKCSDFYIKLVVIIDKLGDNQKKELKKSNPIINSVIFSRNKYYAHKDTDYKIPQYSSRQEIINQMKKELEEVRTCCSTLLPEKITLDYVSHDKDLFRFVHKIDVDREDQLKDEKHPLRNKSVPIGDITMKAFNDVEEYNLIDPSKTHEYGSIVEEGLNFYEGLQNRQDFCIKTNVLFDTDMWCTINSENMEIMLKLQKIGFIDEFGICRIEDLSEETLKEAKKILDENKD